MYLGAKFVCSVVNTKFGLFYILIMEQVLYAEFLQL